MSQNSQKKHKRKNRKHQTEVDYAPQFVPKGQASQDDSETFFVPKSQTPKGSDSKNWNEDKHVNQQNSKKKEKGQGSFKFKGGISRNTYQGDPEFVRKGDKSQTYTEGQSKKEEAKRAEDDFESPYQPKKSEHNKSRQSLIDELQKGQTQEAIQKEPIPDEQLAQEQQQVQEEQQEQQEQPTERAKEVTTSSSPQKPADEEENLQRGQGSNSERKDAKNDEEPQVGDGQGTAGESNPQEKTRASEETTKEPRKELTIETNTEETPNESPRRSALKRETEENHIDRHVQFEERKIDDMETANNSVLTTQETPKTENIPEWKSHLKQVEITTDKPADGKNQDERGGNCCGGNCNIF